MPGTTGSARQEAERLVATVLAMAGQHGFPGAGDGRDDTHSGTAARVADGLGLLGDTVAGLLGQFTGAHPAPDTTKAHPGHSPRSDAPRPGPPQPDTSRTVDDQPDPGPRPDDQTRPTQQRGGGTGPARQSGESGFAQRSAGQAGADHHAGGWATGSAECCVCPICRVITNLRDPSPDMAERLATGAGDFATGLASLLRAFSAMAAQRPAAPHPGGSETPGPVPRPAPDPDTTWSAATRAEAERPPAAGRPDGTRPPTPGVRRGAGRGTLRTGSAAPRPAGPRPRPYEDPWAAATADAEGGVPDMAPSPTVDHDVPGRAAQPERAGAGTTPVAAATEDRAAGTGDDAPAGAAG
ncbi:hypothetical protein EV385_4771 [Krasilnikovia cinnamomea]|uniref:Uncharacterized protein n=1 Tax=Krasilnikovia cinnamomea TaxID=349313 RepID=A0A4Q7ZP94_9ACTN|nr:hypothetical protein [Krasilnikovia cinnamomea]RZU52887.1 hypothetical protein EV385_4771 [Krasilnikovia cinnamomea]